MRAFSNVTPRFSLSASVDCAGTAFGQSPAVAQTEAQSRRKAVRTRPRLALRSLIPRSIRSACRTQGQNRRAAGSWRSPRGRDRRHRFAHSRARISIRSSRCGRLIKRNWRRADSKPSPKLSMSCRPSAFRAASPVGRRSGCDSAPDKASSISSALDPAHADLGQRPAIRRLEHSGMFGATAPVASQVDLERYPDQADRSDRNGRCRSARRFTARMPSPARST